MIVGTLVTTFSSPCLLQVGHGYSVLFFRTLSLWHNTFCEHRGYDWYIRLDDDTYMLPTLKQFLSTQDPSKAVAFGSDRFIGWTHPFLSGGAGWVLSQSAVELLARNAHRCDAMVREQLPCAHLSCEDVNLSWCLRAFGVQLVGLPGMCPFVPGQHGCMSRNHLQAFCQDERAPIRCVEEGRFCIVRLLKVGSLIVVDAS